MKDRVLSVCVGAALCFVNAARAGAGPEPGALVAPIGAVGVTCDADSRRSRLVTVDAGAVRAAARPGAVLQATLFDDATFTLRVGRVEHRAGGLTLHGRVEGDAFGAFVLTLEGEAVSAGVWTSRGAFGLAPAPGRGPWGQFVCEARELERGAVVRCAMGGKSGSGTYAPAAHQEPGAGGALHAGSEAPAALAGGGGNVPRGGGCACGDDQSTLDLLVVYTALARDGAGGMPALQARVQNAIDSMNGALVNSGIHTGGVNRLQVRLAALVEIPYDEQAPEWLDHLDRVTIPDDGIMDDVHALRDQFHADAVSLVVEDDRFTGGGGWWALWNEALAFTCVNWRGLGAGSLLLAHELGHNLGCAHDRENDAAAPLFYAWGHVFEHQGTTYGTIMAYPGDVHIPYYSNPLIAPPPAGEPAGAPLGDPRVAWNARAISQTRWTLTSYRASGRMIDCNANGVEDAVDIASGTSADANDNCRPDECEERLYVDASAPAEGTGASWDDPIRDLASAIPFASLRCNNVREIWVADGTYTPDAGTGGRSARFLLRSGVAMYGGFQGRSRPGGGETSLSQRDPRAYPTALSGDIGVIGESADNSYTVVEASNASEGTVLDGFVVREGHSEWSGAGMYAENSSVVVRDCVFAGNTSGYGAAMLLGGTGVPLIERCTFEDNTALHGGGALWLGEGVSATIDRSTFTGNAARWGGAIAAGDSTFQVRSSVFTGNRATEFNGGALDVTRCAFTLVNSVLAGNGAAGDAGAVWAATDTNGSVINCTIGGNEAGTVTGGVVAYFAHVDVANTILWGNSGGAASMEARQLTYIEATGGVRYSRVQGWDGGLGGPGNSGMDPMLTDPGAGDFSLSAGSGCIDAGDTPATPAGLSLDVLGNARRVDDPATPDSGVGPAPVVDVGAAEYQPPQSCPGDFNSDGGVNSQDFFDFLGAFFAAEPEADFNEDGSINSQDFFDFLGAFFEEC